jgi:hypothetical protein
MSRFVFRYGVWLLYAFMAGALLFLLLIDSVFNGGFDFSVKILWLPLALVIFGFTWVDRQFLYAQMGSRRAPWINATLLYPIAILMSWPYMMALNAATSRGDTLNYTGPIERKWIQHSPRSGDTCMIDFRDRQSSQLVTIRVSSAYYGAHSEGEIASAQFLRGGFGIPYKWRFHQA